MCGQQNDPTSTVFSSSSRPISPKEVILYQISYSLFNVGEPNVKCVGARCSENVFNEL